MKFFSFLSIIFLVIGLDACSNFEDAALTKRNTFVRFYAENISFEAPVVEIDPSGGFIISFNIPKGDNVYDARIIKTDENGSKLWEQNVNDTYVKGIYTFSNGYLLVGYSIEINREATQVSENYNTAALVKQLDSEGNLTTEFTFNESIVVNDVNLTIDFKGDAITLAGDGSILMLGSFKRPEPNSYETSIVTALSPSNLQPIWFKTYALLQRDYINCPVLHLTSNNKLLWASTTSLSLQNNSEAYVSIAYVQPNSTFENNSKLGENDTRNHIVNDLRKSSIGYGIVGTYQEPNNQNSNIYFARVDNNGNIIANSTLYFDGHNDNLLLSNRDESITEDEGNALIGTRDGGYLLGSTVASTPTKGNGGTDIRLIKLDAFGNLLWSELIGGPGDEKVHSLRESTEGNIIIGGTNTINGLSSIVLMKLNEKGSLSE